MPRANWSSASQASQIALLRAADILKRQGAQVEQVELPHFDKDIQWGLNVAAESSVLFYNESMLSEHDFDSGVAEMTKLGARYHGKRF